MTGLFKKEVLMYSLFDIRLKKPFRVVILVYFLIVFLLFGLPIFLITWPPNGIKAAISFGIPLLLANLMASPIFSGRSFFGMLRVYTKFLLAPKDYYDNKSKKLGKNQRFNHYYLIPRRKDYATLVEIERLERKSKKRKRGRRETVPS